MLLDIGLVLQSGRISSICYHAIMHVLYITRDLGNHGILRKWYRDIRRSFYFNEQDGFFEASLCQIANVTEVTAAAVLGGAVDLNRFDATVINLKAKNFADEQERFAFYKLCREQSDNPLALFIGAAQAQHMLSDEVLDTFDVIFKREPFFDKDRYQIAERNKKKIVPSMLSCPVQPIPRENLLGSLYSFFSSKGSRSRERANAVIRDVFFVGKMCSRHRLREDVVKRLVEDSNIDFAGGLLPHDSLSELRPPDDLSAKKLKGDSYISSINAAKINLALDGIGQYTFRHQELLSLGAFMMSGPSIREVELPVPLEEGKHYVAFDDLDDMVEKIRYYLAHEDERSKIAAAGKALFDEYYDPVRHGALIKSRLLNMPGV